MILQKAAFIAASSLAAHQSPNAFLTRSPSTALHATIVRNEIPVLNDSDEHYDKRLTEATMSPHLKEMEYAVRGQVVQAADELSKDLVIHPEAHPGFNKILYTNIGNPHSVGQKPLSWPREVMALCNLPKECLRDPEFCKMFNDDVIERALEITEQDLDGKGTGSYSHSAGNMWFREDIAAFIEKRDGGVKCNPNDIYMTNGASQAIEMVLEALLADEGKGLMIPIPQYPIYSALIALHGAHQVGYYLDEEKGWSIDLENLEKQLDVAKAEGIDVVGLVVINPGNPTGQVLSREALYDVLKFCHKHKLVVLADEVYQENIYDENAEFVSAKQAAFELGLLEHDAIELASFHSTSKGLHGECGHRGGYMELVGFDEKVKEHLYKLASSRLCPNLDGQIMTDLMVRGPRPMDESYSKYEAEKAAVYGELKRKAKLMAEGLNAIPGFSCQPAQGSLYCFPAVEMPQKAIEAAAKAGTTPDTLYAVSLLQSTGICVVPASGFGQKPGRYGFRTTFLPSEEEVKDALVKFRKHHEEFCARYADQSDNALSHSI